MEERLEIAGTPYKLFPVVHIKKLKKVTTYTDRPTYVLRVSEAERVELMRRSYQKTPGRTILKIMIRSGEDRRCEIRLENTFRANPLTESGLLEKLQ